MDRLRSTRSSAWQNDEAETTEAAGGISLGGKIYLVAPGMRFTIGATTASKGTIPPWTMPTQAIFAPQTLTCSVLSVVSLVKLAKVGRREGPERENF